MSGGKPSGVFVKPVRTVDEKAARDRYARQLRQWLSGDRELIVFAACYNNHNGCRAFNRREKT